jgi:anaerobic dimethyl sulfoxide reductase subunit A
MTPTARYADILLPVSHVAEKNDLTRPWPSGPYFTHVNKAIEPLGECKSDFDIACELAQRMGFKDFNPATEDQWLRAFIEKNPETGPLIKDYDKFKREGIHRVKLEEPIIAFSKQIEDIEKNPFETPSGKIEIYSQRLADLDNLLCPPVPKYVGTWEGVNDSLKKKFPLQALTPHAKNRVHSHLGNLDWLVEVEPHRAWINPADAEPRGINNDDEIYIYNDRGKIWIKAMVTERIIPGVICIFEGTWYNPDEHGICKGGCANVLTKDEYSPGGASTLNTLLVEVEKVK